VDDKSLRALVRSVVREDYARGIPDFALSQVASDVVRGVRHHIESHIQQIAHSSSRQRELLEAADDVLTEVETEVKELLEDKLAQFLRNT